MSDRPDPLIVTLEMDAAAQQFFDRLRKAHFPPERNHLSAHVTLFHHLPGGEMARVCEDLRAVCATAQPFDVAVTGLRSLGGGVAFVLESLALSALRADLARRWEEKLTAQDRQLFRPHVTVQNKVPPARARALHAELQSSFAPFAIEGRELVLWRYRGGPWEAVSKFPFAS